MGSHRKLLGLGEFLQQYGLTDLGPILFEKASVADMVNLLSSNRPFFLEHLKEMGIAKITDRQKLANALNRALKDGLLPPARPIPHLEPCTYSETAEQLTVWMNVAPGLLANQIELTFDVNSIDLKVMGQRTSLAGLLYGCINPRDSTWQFERAKPLEYDPLLSAAEQPPPPPDKLVITLVKATPEFWVTLLKSGVAKRIDAPNPVLEARKRREELRKLAEKEAGPIDWCSLERRAVADPGREEEKRAIELMRHRNQEKQAQETPMIDASRHWSGVRAMLVWRDGCDELQAEPLGEGSGLFSWTETRDKLVCRASTRKGLKQADLQLIAKSSVADVLVGGVETLWQGGLVGKIHPAKSRVTVRDVEGQPWALLELTLVKAEPRLWRAPYRDLLAEIETKDAKAHLPDRYQLALGDWGFAESESEFKVDVPIKDCGFMVPDDFRLAVADDSFNLFVRGQEEAPLLAGETFRSLSPRECSWRLSAPRKVGTLKQRTIEITLKKQKSGMWGAGLVKRIYG